MYPAVEVLQEVGRVTVAGSRLDVQLGSLWWHLDPQQIDPDEARRASGATQTKAVRTLAQRRLVGALQDGVLAALVEAEQVRKSRNDAVPQDWVLRGPDGMRPVADITSVERADLPACLDQWDREAVASSGWLRQPARSTDLTQPQQLEELRRVERRPAAGTQVVEGLIYVVASSREVGKPPGYVH